MNTPCQSQISGLFPVPAVFPPLLDALPLAVAVLSPDRRVVFVNRAFEALTGFVHQAAVGIGCAHIMRSSLCVQQCPAVRMQVLAEPVGRHGDIVNRDRQKVPFRLNVARQHLPPLRERGDEVRLLLDRFFYKLAAQCGKPIKGFSAKALRILYNYLYPGNVRELHHIVEHAVYVCREERIQSGHLPSRLIEMAPSEPGIVTGTAAPTASAVSARAAEAGESGQRWEAMSVG